MNLRNRVAKLEQAATQRPAPPPDEPPPGEDWAVLIERVGEWAAGNERGPCRLPTREIERLCREFAGRIRAGEFATTSEMLTDVPDDVLLELRAYSLYREEERETPDTP